MGKLSSLLPCFLANLEELEIELFGLSAGWLGGFGKNTACHGPEMKNPYLFRDGPFCF